MDIMRDLDSFVVDEEEEVPVADEEDEDDEEVEEVEEEAGATKGTSSIKAPLLSLTSRFSTSQSPL